VTKTHADRPTASNAKRAKGRCILGVYGHRAEILPSVWDGFVVVMRYTMHMRLRAIGVLVTMVVACANPRGTRTALQYERGTVVAHDPVRAMKLLEIACERNSSFACKELGTRYLEGAGVPKDLTKAVGLLRTACELGMPMLCVELGAMVGEGSHGAAPDETAAMELHTIACEQGLVAACKIKNQIWPEGVSQAEQRERDAARAAEDANRGKEACEEGDMPACGNLGAQMIDGNGVPADPSAGQRLLQGACDAGDAPSCTFLAIFLLDGEKSPRDPTRARKLLTKACALNDSVACTVLEDAQ
jgi:TPR repeat protein